MSETASTGNQSPYIMAVDDWIMIKDVLQCKINKEILLYAMVYNKILLCVSCTVEHIFP